MRNLGTVHPGHPLISRSANGKLITKVAEATAKDVDIAVDAAQKAFDTVWGLNATGERRGMIMNKLADLMDAHSDELAALEALDNGSFLLPIWITGQLMCALCKSR